MQSPPNISFRHIEGSPELRDHIEKRMGELEAAYPDIVGCDVVVEAPRKKQVTGTEFLVRITLRVPGPDIHVERHFGRSGGSEDLNLAIHGAFDAARRILKEQKREMGALEVKHHPPILHGAVCRLFEGEGYGFALADDGHELYFGQESLTAGNWGDLKVGTRLRFREMEGDKGRYAANVAVLT
jgi:ribosome-associated translation inhibitor RaiA/cold shock CspA family protein